MQHQEDSRTIKKSRMTIVLLVSLLATSIAVATASACLTRTPGYWKTHPEEWCLTPGVPFTTDEGDYGFAQDLSIPSDAMDILWMPVKGDARINLQQKVIAASLSIAMDPDTGWDYTSQYDGGTPLAGPGGLVDQANILLDDNPGPWTPRSAADESGVRDQGLALASAIDYWLNYYDVD